MERKRPLCGCGRDGKCHDDDDDGGANVLPCNRATCTNCSQDQSGSCCPRGPLAQLQFDGLPGSHTNVWKGEKTSESWKNQASFQSDLPFFCLKLEPSYKPGFLFSGPTIRFCGARMAWIFFWLKWKPWKAATREPITLSKAAWFHLFFIGGTACRGPVSLYHTITARHPLCHLSLGWYHRAADPPSPGQDLVLNGKSAGSRRTHFY